MESKRRSCRTDSANLAFNPSALAPGSHTVSVDVTGDCGSASAQTTLTINDATDISDPPDNAEACDVSHGPVQFTVTASGTGTLHYAWTVDNVAAGTDSATLSYDPFALNPGAHTVKVVVTSDCGSDDATATLTILGQPSATIGAHAGVCRVLETDGHTKAVAVDRATGSVGLQLSRYCC